MPGAVHFTVKIAPGGLASSGDDEIDNNALFASLNFISAWDFSENRTLLIQSYPLLRAAAAWWVGDGTGSCRGWLTKELLPGSPLQYRFNDNNTCTREFCMDPGAPRGTRDLNPTNSIAFLMRLLKHLITVAERGLVHPPAEELARWVDVLAHLAPIPMGMTRFNASVQANVPVLLPQEHPVFTYPRETGDIPIQFQPVYPAEQIGLGSAPELLTAARNTMLLYGALFRQKFSLKEAIGSHACSLEASKRAGV
jgi:hypothetical protein